MKGLVAGLLSDTLGSFGDRLLFPSTVFAPCRGVDEGMSVGVAPSEASTVGTVFRVKRKATEEPISSLSVSFKRRCRDERATSAEEGEKEAEAETPVQVRDEVFRLAATAPSDLATEATLGDVFRDRKLRRIRLADVKLDSFKTGAFMSKPSRATTRPPSEKRSGLLEKIREIDLSVSEVTCNGEAMVVLNPEAASSNAGFVFDLYVRDTGAPEGADDPTVGEGSLEEDMTAFFDDLLWIRPVEQELVDERALAQGEEEEVYEDEDDENEEGNWRNDYPDEDEDFEDRYEYCDGDFDLGARGNTYSCFGGGVSRGGGLVEEDYRRMEAFRFGEDDENYEED